MQACHLRRHLLHWYQVLAVCVTPHPGVSLPWLKAKGIQIIFRLDEPNFKILLFQELLGKKSIYLKELKIPFKDTGSKHG